MKFTDAIGNIKYGKAMFFGNNIQMSEQADGIVTINAGILSGTGTKLSLLGDVSITSIQDDQFVRWNAGTSLWINQFITAADVGAGTFKTGTFTFPNTVVHSNLSIFSGTDLGDILPTITGNSTIRVAGNIQQIGDNLIIGGGSVSGPTSSYFSANNLSDRGEPLIVAYKSRGTLTSPSGVKNLDRLFSLQVGGWKASAWAIAGNIAWEALGDWSASATGCRIKFFITSSGVNVGAYIMAMENFVFYPIVDNSVSLGTTALRFKDLPLAGNLTVSGTTTLIGAATQRVGTSATFAKWPSILFADATVHFYSGTAETSLSSYTLKGSSITANGQAIKIRGDIERASNGGSNFHIKLGNICVIVSGTLGSVQRTSFEGTLYRSSANAVRTFWTVYSGVSDPQVGSSSIATSILGNVVGASAIDWTQDQLIDFRASNYVADTSGISLNFWQISYEAP